jgi:undecaprenyl-diphosphatase
MALNVRFLQKAGVPSATGVAAVGVNSLVGALVHVVMLVVFAVVAGHALTQAFKLPSASKLLLVLAVLAALVGIFLATRKGRRFARTRPAQRSGRPAPACGRWQRARPGLRCWWAAHR